MAEMYGKVDGCSRGRGGSMHFFDANRRFFGGHAIVGGGLPIAVGLALADNMRANRRVTACFFGDGAGAEGEFHESLNLAALWGLPVLFLCENNLYAMGTGIERALVETELHSRAASYHIASDLVDGMDVLAVEEAVTQAAETVRQTGKPYFVEFKTYRFRAHSMADPDLYRSKEEVEAWKLRDPIVLFADRLRTWGHLSEADERRLEGDVLNAVNDAVSFAEASPPEPVENLTKDVMTS
jgi:TPP-dependent pyruvate/acetoin dehydrogenase alpha subunit